MMEIVTMRPILTGSFVGWVDSSNFDDGNCNYAPHLDRVIRWLGRLDENARRGRSRVLGNLDKCG